MRRAPTIAALLLGLSASAIAGGLGRAAPVMDAAAPELVATVLDGQSFDLAKLRGKVVLVNFWATWCAPCRKEMPTLDAFYRRYRGQGFEMIGVSVDFARDAGKMRKAAAAVAYPTAMASDLTVDGFGPPEGVPVTYVIDAQGVVRDRHDHLLGLDYQSVDDLKAALEALPGPAA